MKRIDEVIQSNIDSKEIVKVFIKKMNYILYMILKQYNFEDKYIEVLINCYNINYPSTGNETYNLHTVMKCPEYHKYILSPISALGYYPPVDFFSCEEDRNTYIIITEVWDDLGYDIYNNQKKTSSNNNKRNLI